MYITRDLNTRNIEIFRIRKEIFGDLLGCLVMIDFKRPSSLEDFPYLKGIEDEKDFGKDNFIKVIMISKNEVKEKEKEEIINMIEGFLGEKEECDWNIDYYIDEIDFDEIEINEVIKKIQIIIKENYQQNIVINEIDPKQFKYLSQD